MCLVLGTLVVIVESSQQSRERRDAIALTVRKLNLQQVPGYLKRRRQR